MEIDKENNRDNKTAANQAADSSLEMSFEQAMERLEVIAAEIERGEGTLDYAMALYEEGVKLAKYCEAMLSDLTERLNVLRIAPDGSETKEPILDR
jgi:exodeoxyribonuclease VII small subunit